MVKNVDLNLFAGARSLAIAAILSAAAMGSALSAETLTLSDCAGNSFY